MKIVDYCVVCNASNLSCCKAVVTPFIAERCFNSKAFETQLLRCPNCELGFFKLRFDSLELESLYRGYRGDKYLAQRNKFEPWYTARLNSTLFQDQRMLRGRQDSLLKLIDGYDPDLVKRARSILDYGGDDGKLIFGIFENAKKYVFEISEAPLKPGIYRAPSPQEIKFDLVICSNVFEHAPFPHELMDQIGKFCSEGTVLYLEVPHEKPFSFDTLRKRVIQQVLLLFMRPKQFFETFGFGMFTHLHEHINYFSVKSLHELLQRHGFTDISVFIEVINGYPHVCGFARKKDLK